MHAANPLRASLIWFICINVILNAKNWVDVKAKVQSNKNKDNLIKKALYQFYSLPGY